MSMIEIICSVSIILIVMSSVNVNTGMRYYRMRCFAREFVNDIRYVRMKNINNIDRAHIRYKNGDVMSYELRENGMPIKEVRLEADMKILYSKGIISFRNSGRFNGKGETIKIIDERSKREIVITIVPFSGRVLERTGRYE